MIVEIEILGNTSIERITNTFNLSFSDYFVPVHLTTGQLSQKMKVDKINLDYSVGAFENGNLIAFILHGVDILDNVKVVYNGGTGVVPKQRGQGLTKRMYDFILPVLREKKVAYLLLEAISKNIQAIKSYEKVGYKAIRGLNCYTGQISLKSEKGNINIRKLIDYDWILMQSFWDFKPTWQNSANVADILKDSNISFGAYINNRLAGYIIFNPNNKRIQQIAVHKDFRRMGIASALFSVLIKESDNNLSIVNVDEGSQPVNTFLQKIGFENFLTQIEMKFVL